jgi:uncharacterized protein (TIGR02646 family)
MILLHRPPVPHALASSCADAEKALWDAWGDGQKIETDNGVYAHAEVKSALRTAQHNKCAYCETINPTSHDVVEHYRPKNGWRQEKHDALTKPEYFWLSYRWQNLLFACDTCNDRGHKQNLFPLANPSERATPDKPDTSIEVPLLLDPYVDDPKDHIEWSRDIPRAHRSSAKGLKTIEICGLDKDGLLMDQRRKYLNDLETLLTAFEGLSEGDHRRLATRPVFRQRIEDSAPWAAMVRENLGQRIAAF